MSTTGLSDTITPDLLVALDQGYDAELYLAGRAAGCTHAELLGLPGLVVTYTKINAYIIARHHGATAAQLRDEILAAGYNLPSYAAALALGATHDQILHIATHHPSQSPVALPSHQDVIGQYVIALGAGATHAEVCQALAYVPLIDYALTRTQGCSHVAYMDALSPRPVSSPTVISHD